MAASVDDPGDIIYEDTMDSTTKKDIVYGAGEGYPSTGAVAGSQVGPAASSARDHGRSGVDRQAPGRVSASGEDSTKEVVADESMEPAAKVTRRTRRTAAMSDRPGSEFRTPPAMPYSGASAGLPQAGAFRGRARSDDEESLASMSSLSSTASQGRKRKIVNNTPEVTDEMVKEMRTTTVADIGAVMIRGAEEIMRVANTSSNLKGTYVKILKGTAASIVVGSMELARRTGTGSNEGESRMLWSRLYKLEEENATLRRQLADRGARLPQECRFGDPLTSESGRRPQDGGRENIRLSALETKVDEIGPSIMRALEERLRAWRISPEDRPREPSGTERTPSASRIADARQAMRSRLPKGSALPAAARRAVPSRRDTSRSVAETSAEEMEIVPSVTPGEKKRRGRKKKQVSSDTRSEKTAASAGPKSFAEAAARPPTPALRKGGEVVEGRGGRPAKTGADRVRLPRVPQCSAVTLTLTGDSDFRLADAVMKARQRIRLEELGITALRPKRAMTGALILEIQGDEGGRKAGLLAQRMTEVLRGDPVNISTPRKTAEMRVTRLDESVTVGDVLEAVAKAGDCRIDEITVGELRRAPRGLTSAWIRCPLTAAKRIFASGGDAGGDCGGSKRIVVGWSEARISPLPTRRLQCFKCLEPGHVRKDCKSAIDRSDRCYRCGETGHRARECSTRVPRCPVCSDLGAPAAHRMGSLACKPPTPRRRKGTIQDGGGGAAADKPKETAADTAGGKNAKGAKDGGADPEKSDLGEAMDVDAVSLRPGTSAGQP